MKIKEIKDSQTWNNFFNNNGSPSFLQSWEWGEFQQDLGYGVEHLGIYRDSELKAIAQIIKIKSKRGNFFFIPHGPVFLSKNSNQPQTRTSSVQGKQSAIRKSVSQLLNYLIILAKKEGYSFIRVAPILENTEENSKLFADVGFKEAPIYMHAERLWFLPLYHIDTDRSTMAFNKNPPASGIIPDEHLLAQMRKTTRYLIRKAEREGVIIEKRTDAKAIDDFWKIYQETATRENFVPFSKEFIKKEFEVFNKTGNALFLFGRINNVVIPDSIRNPEKSEKIDSRFRGNDNNTTSNLASALIIFTKSTAFYHQGASIHTKVPVTYLLQWEAIKEARRRGCRLYNFWGIYQESRTPRSWQGLTLFKTGFGGGQVDYVPTQDFIISPKYYLTYIYEKFLAWRRGV